MSQASGIDVSLTVTDFCHSGLQGRQEVLSMSVAVSRLSLGTLQVLQLGFLPGCHASARPQSTEPTSPGRSPDAKENSPPGVDAKKYLSDQSQGYLGIMSIHA